MTIDEAIIHCHEKVKELRQSADLCMIGTEVQRDCLECAREHEQLAEWLMELKELREYIRLICKGLENLTDEECRYIIAIETKMQKGGAE